MDVGSPSAQFTEGDRLKAAFSDALKRAAVKFGIGRYLYHLPGEWVEYDPSRRQLVRQPRLPDWAQPTDDNRQGKRLASRGLRPDSGHRLDDGGLKF